MSVVMTSSRNPSVWSRLLLVAAVYLIARPYWGIAHDAQIYVGQALNLSHPGLLANDLFFRYGSQDRFTIFSAIFGPLVAWVVPIGWRWPLRDRRCIWADLRLACVPCADR